MRIEVPHAWPSTVAEAEAVQDRLRSAVDLAGPGPQQPQTVAGLDVAYEKDSDRLVAAVVVLDTQTLTVISSATAEGRAAFDYVPGLFAFRELPALVAALEHLPSTPELLVCDGQGLAHPRRFGIACHLGVLTGIPTIGVAKTTLIGDYCDPGPERGCWSPLLIGGEVVGRVVRTQTGIKPVFVSVGHRIDLETAYRHVLTLSRRYRLPETTRRADQLARRLLR